MAKRIKLARIRQTVAAALLALWTGAAAAQELVHFPSLDTAVPTLDGYLYRPQGEGAHPAVVFMHGCAGMFVRGAIAARQTDWATALTARGFVVLMVDSFGPRHHGEMCSVQGFDLHLYHQRPKDAYGALAWLQAQPYVRADRIGIVGWSEGGGVVLYSIGLGGQSLGRPPDLRQPDFRVAVAFYPASCRDNRQPPDWTTAVPLFVLIGDADVWTPAVPCVSFLQGAVSRGTPVSMQIYPGAYHGFDSPGVSIRELPDYRTAAGVVPIVGTDPAARQDAFTRVPEFLARYLGN